MAEPAPARPTAPVLIGRTLGKFTIVERLGKGGSGEVFRAEQVQLGRSAVIKVLRHEVASAPNRVERFLREAKLASRLDHPYAAHVYAFGVEPDGVLWIAMEYVRGVTLDQLVAQRGAMPAAVFAPLFGRLCEVVHSAHELGIVHRDIKGANVMVIERAGQLLPKLLDFGIAKSEDMLVTPGVTSSELTGHGVTLGSPHYMSPEQWERPAEVDARADIYALGVLAYRCVSGVLPFHNIDRSQLSAAHLHRAPPPLPDDLPAPLATAILRAMAKQPEARWPTAIAFADAIRMAAGGAPPETVPFFDPGTREAWLGAGPQPIADAIAHLTSATTTVEADAALGELVAITCRWLAVLALASLPETSDPSVREHARAVIGRDDGAPWLRLARAAVAASPSPLPGLEAALAGADPLAQLANRLDDRERTRTAAALGHDVAAAAEALRPLEPLLAYQLVVGTGGAAAESWQGPRRRDRDKVLVWGEPLRPDEVALLDASGQVVAQLSPLAQVIAPLPSAEPELFLLWRGGRGPARLVAAPWGFERDDDAAGVRLAALSTEDSDTAMEPANDRSPYPGLASYGTDDADRFVGREREIETLANRLVRAPLLAVLGPSGVGKSSFIHAGLVPRLGEQHRVLTMRPGRHPLHALAALPPVSGDASDERGLVARLRELGESAQRGLVLVVDQLEELVTLCASADERRRFAETLAAAADGPSAPVRVVATLRDDFATVIETEAALRGTFEVFVLATPPPEALRRIVIEPARRAAVTVDPRVVDDMVAEVAGRPASLPLLSFTASQLWAARDRAARTITYDSYLALGGVAGALATYADHVYASLARRDQDTVRDLFARLVAADGTRVPSPRAELEQLPGAPGVLSHLIDARLLVVREDEGRDVIEIVHECLAERWPRLARWRSEDAADRALLGDVRAAARRWQEAGHRADLLWRGEALAELRRLVARSTALTVLERTFADEAVRAQQRARRIRRGVVAGVMTVLASAAGVMAYLSVQADRSRAAAEHSATQAHDAAKLAEDRLTQSLIAQGRRELNDHRAFNALAYLREALARGADTRAVRLMISFANRGRGAERLVTHPGGLNAFAESPSGYVVVGDLKGTLTWFTPDGKRAGELATGLTAVNDIARLPDDTLAVCGPHEVVIVDPQHRIAGKRTTKGQPWTARLGPNPHELTVMERDALRVYAPDGTVLRSLAMPTDQGIGEPMFDAAVRHVSFDHMSDVVVVDLVAMTEKTIAKETFGSTGATPDGSTMAYIDRDGGVHLYKPDGTLGLVLHPSSRPQEVVFSEAGDRLAAIGARDVIVYDLAGKEQHRFMIPAQQNAFVVRGDDFWSAGDDGSVRRYHEGMLVSDRPSHTTPLRALSVIGDAVVSVGEDSTLVIARADEAELVPDPQVCKRPSFGPLGSLVSYICPELGQLLYAGRRVVARLPAEEEPYDADHDPATQRTVIHTDRGIVVYGPDAKETALLPADPARKLGGPAFADPDHVLLVEHGAAVWQWTVSTNKLDKIAAVPAAVVVTPIAGGLLVGTDTGHAVLLRDGRPVHDTDVHDRVMSIATSPDRAWVGAQLGDGALAILDGKTGALARVLEPAEQTGAAPVFDASGELLIREARSEITIWDRATGDQLIAGLELLGGMMGGRFLPDGRIEAADRGPTLLDIPLDARPASQILSELACRVPLRVQGGRLEPSTPDCR